MDADLHNIEPDSTGKLKDLSKTDNVETAPDYTINGETAYLFTVKEYTYKLVAGDSPVTWNYLTNTLKIWEKEWPDFYAYGKPTLKSGVLVDSKGYCLFSWELLKLYGIGFILSDWIIKDADNKYKIKFKPSYFQNWYSSSTTFTEDEKTVDDIYSSKILFDNVADFNNKTDCSSSISDTEKAIKQLFGSGPFWSYDTQKANVEHPNDLKKENYFKVMATRFYPGTKMLGLKYENNDYTTQEVYITPCSTGGTFVSLNINPFQYGSTYGEHFTNKFEDTFIRYQITEAEVTAIGNIINGGQSKVWTLAKWIINSEKTTDSNEPVEELWTIRNPYTSTDTDPYTPTGDAGESGDYGSDGSVSQHEDYHFIEKVLVDNQPVVKTKKTVRLKSMLEDISPLNVNKITDWKDVTYVSTTTSEIDDTINTNTPASKTLEEAFSEENLKQYKTPSEFYSNSETSYLSDMEDAFDKQNITKRTWFWLDTIKNWVMYTMNSDGILYLGAWDGLGGWDRMEGIIWSVGSPNYLAAKYMYIPDFFKHGCKYLDPWCATAQVRFPDGNVARMYYNYMILSHENITNNYTDKFQTKHDTKITWNYERSEVSNWGIGATALSDGTTIFKDPTRKGVQEVDTQFCPTIIKMADGSLGLVFTMLIEKTGWSPSNIYTKMLISADKANDKCKEIFGAGDDKTIDKDWKRYFNNDTTEEKPSNITTNINDTITGAANLLPIKNKNKINSMTFFANRPLPITNDREDIDFVDRWKD